MRRNSEKAMVVFIRISYLYLRELFVVVQIERCIDGRNGSEDVRIVGLTPEGIFPVDVNKCRSTKLSSALTDLRDNVVTGH